MKEVFGSMPQSCIALETGTRSPWVSRMFSGLGHEVIVAHARNVRLIGESRRKDDRLDAQTLTRLARIDPQLPGETPQCENPLCAFSLPVTEQYGDVSPICYARLVSMPIPSLRSTGGQRSEFYCSACNTKFERNCPHQT
jgi:hypothetical protein